MSVFKEILNEKYQEQSSHSFPKKIALTNAHVMKETYQKSDTRGFYPRQSLIHKTQMNTGRRGYW